MDLDQMPRAPRFVELQVGMDWNNTQIEMLCDKLSAPRTGLSVMIDKAAGFRDYQIRQFRLLLIRRIRLLRLWPRYFPNQDVSGHLDRAREMLRAIDEGED
jgi:hypothetical protein